MRTWVIAGAAAMLLCAPAAGAAERARYQLASGCWALRSLATGGYVARDGDGYRANATDRAAAEPFRLQATDLGWYLLYGPDATFLSADGAAREPGDGADWRVQSREDGAFVLELPARGGALVADDDGALALGDGGSPAARFDFERRGGCAEYPEVQSSVSGTPSAGRTPYGEVRGFAEGHLHMMAFEFLGGSVHCGRPWHRFGAPYALVDCPDHYVADGNAAVAENLLSRGSPAGGHDPVGWPTFRDWPHHASYTHEQTYYKWLERAWAGGLRLMVNLLVDNAVLCEVYPLKRNSCNEMDGVRLQATRIHELQDYIDAQNGGPGRGWFRIVHSPFEAREVINDGKLAVVLGIEVSKLFDCGEFLEQPECDERQIDAQLDEVYRLGVRQMELVNKFDNALSGVAGDGGTLGVAVNSGNKYETGHYWKMRTCEGPEAAHDHDKEQMRPPGTDRDALVGSILDAYLPAGTLPLYTEPPHCNDIGLTRLGEYLIRRMAEKGMVFDPDHMSVRARDQAMDLIEELDHPGVISSHSWATPGTYRRIAARDGVITPHAGSSKSFVDKWRDTKAMYREGAYFGLGFGSDMNGFSAQGAPRGDAAQNPVRYPFRSFEGAVLLDRQRSGERVFDFNVDGVAHYGLYPDWIEDLRVQAGDEIVADMARGAEAYLRMWERAVGVPAVRRSGTLRVRRGQTARQVLFTAGQPADRRGRVWTYRTRGDNLRVAFNRRGRVKSVRR